jgi:hypothetical protein
MAAVKDMFYDIETLFIEGRSARQIARELLIDVEQVHAVLDTFTLEDEGQEDIDAVLYNYYGA